MKTVEEFFGNCPTCEPIMCCWGRDCGCKGLPVDFKATKNCGKECLYYVETSTDSKPETPRYLP